MYLEQDGGGDEGFVRFAQGIRQAMIFLLDNSFKINLTLFCAGSSFRLTADLPNADWPVYSVHTCSGPGWLGSYRPRARPAWDTASAHTSCLP